MNQTTPHQTGFTLRGGSAIVTGAGTGIGRELALAFGREGASVVCCGRRAEPVRETAALIEKAGGQALAVAADVTNRDQVDSLVQATLKRFGRIDLLYNNAGSFRPLGAVWQADPETWWQDVTVNLYGAVLCCMAVLPHMRERRHGIIINMDGGGGACGPDIVLHRLGTADVPRFNGANVGGSAYGCSKAALMRFTEGLARELEIDGSPVLVFGMNPGFVRTAMTEQLPAAKSGNDWQAFVGHMFEQGVDRPPTDCAQAALRLLRAASPALNGCVFDVDTDFEEVHRHESQVRKNELYLMRLRDPRADRYLVDDPSTPAALL